MLVSFLLYRIPNRYFLISDLISFNRWSHGHRLLYHQRLACLIKLSSNSRLHHRLPLVLHDLDVMTDAASITFLIPCVMLHVKPQLVLDAHELAINWASKRKPIRFDSLWNNQLEICSDFPTFFASQVPIKVALDLSLMLWWSPGSYIILAWAYLSKLVETEREVCDVFGTLRVVKIDRYNDSVAWTILLSVKGDFCSEWCLSTTEEATNWSLHCQCLIDRLCRYVRLVESHSPNCS